VSNHPEWLIEAALGICAAFLVSATAWFSRRKDDADEAGWGQSLAIAAPSLSAGLVFGCAALGLPMEPPEPGDRLRSAGMIVLSLLVRQSMSGLGSSSIPATRIFSSPCSQDP
jgi:hypothetical protein